MFKLIYLPTAETAYIELSDPTRNGKLVYGGRHKNREFLDGTLEEYFFFERVVRVNKMSNIRRIAIFGSKDLPKNKRALPKHLFEIMEFPDV